eukprot:2861297-Pleurochrysis_carterae.AAC.1
MISSSTSSSTISISNNLAPDHVKEARVVLGLGEAKLDEDLAGRLVPLASFGGVAVHVSNLCNHLAANLVPPLVALRDVGVNFLVGWPVSLRVSLGYITALHVKVMLSGDGKDGAQRGVLDGGRCPPQGSRPAARRLNRSYPMTTYHADSCREMPLSDRWPSPTEPLPERPAAAAIVLRPRLAVSLCWLTETDSLQIM